MNAQWWNISRDRFVRLIGRESNGSNSKDDGINVLLGC
jgi:hypothetical protein